MNPFFQRELTIWGPLFLICAVGLGGSYDFLLFAVFGFFLSTHYQVKGSLYALVFLALGAICKHAFFLNDHLWDLGLEGSLGISFFLTALTFEEKSAATESLHAQIGRGETALKNLEEEFAKNQEEVISAQMGTQVRLDQVQKELEDLQADHSSILILNEVLRKTSARYAQEKEASDSLASALKWEMAQAKQDLKNAVPMEGQQILKELNAARVSKEQIHLINETLARLYMRENLKAKEADLEAGAIGEQLNATRREMERLKKAMDTAGHDPQLKEELDYAREKMIHLSQTEPVLKQLKKQFEEKNQILHQTRSELFKTDTELQRLKMEQAARELNPIPQEVDMELQRIGEQAALLEEENQQLHELIAVLMENDASSRKKKLKTKSPSTSEQDLLF